MNSQSSARPAPQRRAADAAQTVPLSRRSFALLGAASAACTLAPISAGRAAASPAPAGPAPADPAPAASEVALADPGATARTRSLFAALRDIDAQGVLFGHQEDLSSGETFADPDGTSSDVAAVTGDHPAVIGFDTLEVAGMSTADREARASVLATRFHQAHDVGAIPTMSWHLENLVTGDDFYDTSGDALRAVLPGGSHHADLVAALDRLVIAFTEAVDAEGEPIPIIFRPWHENDGSWFWWGAASATAGEYAELFRFTVEHLRDVRGVHNLLYAFSPGGGYAGDAERYLRTYPGDAFVDVIGIDTYDDSGASAAYRGGLTRDLAMLGTIAQERGKISALTEYGISGGVRPDGQNASTTWFTDILGAVTADPAAARTAYMMTWANYGGDSTPYTPVDGELLPDFVAFHADPVTRFADDLTGVHDVATTALPAAAAHLARPADGSRVPTGPIELLASVTGHAADAVRLTVPTPDGETTLDLAAPKDGSLWWSGSWDVPDALLDNSTRPLTLHVLEGGTELAAVASAVVLGPEPELAPGVVDDFEGYGDLTALGRSWSQRGANTLALVRADEGGVVGEGDVALRMSYSFESQTYTGISRTVEGDWSSFAALEAWIAPDASANLLVLQLVADGVAFEAYPSLAGEDPFLARLPFADWRPAPWDTAHAERRLDAATLAAVTQFSIFCNAADHGATSGAITVDGLRAVPALPDAVDVPPGHRDAEAIAWLRESVLDLADCGHRFHPRRAVTGAELAEVLAAYAPGAAASAVGGVASRASLAQALWSLAGSPSPQAPPASPDVSPSAPEAEAIAWVTEVGIIEAEGRFGPRVAVRREELARWLRRTDLHLRG
ncbi:glycosyl hydrolase [Brachybacterium phenoliresistens]|uniref:glycosyl hydrolase n=1 Tax=Brachybacterium phenoliresistens TaxID=396014 RepID=UPI0031D78F50